MHQTQRLTRLSKRLSYPENKMEVPEKFGFGLRGHECDDERAENRVPSSFSALNDLLEVSTIHW